MVKVCFKCNQEKDIFDFYKDKSKKDGLYYQCKECCKEKDKKYYQKNRKIILKRCKEYAKNNLEKRREILRRWVKNNPYRKWALQTINYHKRKGNQINITIDELEEKAKNTKNCPICEIKLDWNYGYKKSLNINSPSLDRINNQKILNKDNVWTICYRCNLIKLDGTLEELINYCRKVVNKYGR